MEPVISISHLFKSYGYKHVLKDINLDAYAGQVIGYIGPNGAGKSTTVKILCGLLPEFDGEVTIKGLDIRKNPVEVKKSIGYIPELAELYDVLTPREFLTFCGDLYEIEKDVLSDRISRMLAAFDLHHHIDERMDTFSKGMRQKVLIASGLLHNPDVIIMDEPLSGLDANSVIIIKDLISKLAKEGKTIFYCSHMMDVVEKVSHRIILIDDGRVIADGSIEELRSKQGDKSLEQIFAQMTGKESLYTSADDLVRAMEK